MDTRLWRLSALFVLWLPIQEREFDVMSPTTGKSLIRFPN